MTDWRRCPASPAIDSAGTLYTTDTEAIYRISPAGDVTPVAGTPGTKTVTRGDVPTFAPPMGIAVDGDSLIIVDSNAVLRLRPVR